MKLRGRNLEPNMRGEDVALLQDALRQLSFDISDAKSFFGTNTLAAVRKFQQEQGLELVDGIVNSKTAERITRMLAVREGPQPNVVGGRVLNASGKGISGRLVRAFSVQLETEQTLGTDTTDERGAYAIRYEPDQDSVSLQVRAFSSAGNQQPLVSSPLILNAEAEETVNLAVGDEAFRGEALFEQAETALLSKTDREVLPRLGEKARIMLARQAGLPERRVSAVIEAHKLAGRTNLDAEVWFALLGQDTTADVSALLAQGKAAHRSRLKAAIRDNIIPASFEERLDEIVDKLRDLAVEDMLEGGGSSSTGDVAALLSTFRLSAARKRRFLRAYLDNEDPLPEFWERLKDDFGQRVVEGLQLTFQLGALTLNHAPLVRAVKAARNVADARELAGLEVEDWLELMDTVPPPEAFEGETARADYAKAIVSLAAKAFPTARLLTKWTQDSELGTASFRTFWNNNPEFEFRGSPVRRYVTENPGALDGIADQDGFVRELEGVHRLFSLVPDAEKFESVRTLSQAGLRSAHAIVRHGRGPFLRRVAGAMGEEQATRVYAQARQKAALSLATLVKYSPLFNQLNPQVLGNLASADPPDSIPDWPSLFGSLDFCECRHCRSILSPAAYFVDLLQFLERADAGEQSALEALLGHRPDMAHVRLDCPNTNTAMPYIDLVNEVLENAIVNGLLNLGNAIGLQTTGTTEALRANPQHINLAAYTELAEAGFPWSLPFNLWHEERAIYLGHLGIRVWELMDILHREGEDPEPIDRAAAYLGMMRAEREIIVDAGGNHNLGNTNVVLTLMRRSQTGFGELKELLTSRFINPSGKEIVFADDSCALEDATLALNDNERNHLHRFRRLQRITQLSVFELDLILDVLPFNDITDEFLIQLAFLGRLKERFRLPVPELLGWWAPAMPTRGDGERDSLYTELFLNQIVNNPLTNIEQIFRLNGAGTELQNLRPFFDGEGHLDADISPLVVGALGITEEELRLLIGETLPSTEMNLRNLSHLYRMASLSRALNLAVRDVLMLVRLTGRTGVTGFDLTDNSLLVASPEDTWAWIVAYDRLRGPGFRVDELSYLLLHRFEPSFALPLSDVEIGVSLTELQGELRKLRPQPPGGEIPTAQELENITAWLTENLTLVLNDVEEALRIIRGVSELTDAQQAGFIEDNFSPFLTPETLANLTEENDRLLYVHEQLLTFLLRNVVIQRLAEITGLEVKVTQALLIELLPNPDATDQPAIGVFLDDSFLAGSEPENPASIPGPYGVLHHLAKLKVILDRLAIVPEDLVFIISRGGDLGWYDLRSFPLEPAADETVNIEAWSRFLDAQSLSLRLFSRPFSLAKLLAYVESQEATRSGVLATVAGQTGWEFESLEFLSGAGGYDFSFPDDFLDERWLSRLSEAFRLIDKAGVSGPQIWHWNVPEANEGVARNIKNAAKARHSVEQWLTIAPDLSDQLRIRRRDALVDFLVANNSSIDDSDDLFGRLLIDPAVQPCFLTSRIKQAISSVQLFVHRVFLGLESDVRFEAEDADQWRWRKNYRIWEAGRKVFLYPENYAEPELRSEKSPFFVELEDNLLQEEVTADSVERAYLRYLRNLDEVARLEIAGHYIEEGAGIVHIFARTQGVPHAYYYRRFIDNAYFTPWERVEVNVEGDHILPVVYNRRLWLLWLTFTEKAVQPLEDTSPPLKYHQIKLSWSEYKDGGWSSSKTSEASISTRVRFNGVDSPGEAEFFHGVKGRFYFWAEVEDGALSVYPFYHTKNDPYNIWQPNQFFRMQGCDSDFARREDVQTFKPFGGLGGAESVVRGAHIRKRIPYRVPNGYYSYAMKFRQDDALVLWSQLSVTSSGQLSAYEQELILNNAPGSFLITPPHQYTRFFSQGPLFYEDATRTFLILPQDVVSTSDSGRTAMFSRGNSSLDLIRTVRATTLPSLPRTEIPDRSSTLPGSLVSNTAVFTSGSESLVIDRRPISSVAGLVAEVEEDDEEESDAFFRDMITPSVPSVTPSVFDIGEITTPNSIKKYRFLTFYHPYSCLFIEQLNRFGVDGLLKPRPTGPGKELYRQLTPNSGFAFSTYGPQPGVVQFPHPTEKIDFRYGGAYSDYNWEVFFHIPLLIADRLSQNRRFEEAQRWYHYIFDPTETDDAGLDSDERFRRYWKIKPFFEFSKASSIQQIIKLINEGDEEYENQVARWEADPFNPHLIASLRVVSYMKMVVMKYLDNLIAWADNLFQRDTIESINEATQLYVLAAQILGRQPVEVSGKEAAPRTYNSLRDNLDVLGNALVSLEAQFAGKPILRFSKVLEKTQPDQGAAGSNVFLAANAFALAPGLPKTVEASGIFGGSLTFVSPDGEPEPDNPLVLYFCIPNNQKLLEYFDTLADRLFKIRNCMNIEGVTRTLALFEPPIDPALLVKAAAAGLDLKSALDDLNAPLPNYRFVYMLQKAIDLCSEVKTLGSALLSALEKRDVEQLALLRASHTIQLMKAGRHVRRTQIEEALRTKEALEEGEFVIKVRQSHYSKLLNSEASVSTAAGDFLREDARQLLAEAESLALNESEKRSLFKFGYADHWRSYAYPWDKKAANWYLLPNTSIGFPLGISVSYGGSNVGPHTGTWATLYRFKAEQSTFLGQSEATLAGYQRREEDWRLQLNLATNELAQLKKQITAAEIRVAIAEKELASQELQIKQSLEEEVFLKEKFTNRQLYSRMVSQISTAYFQSYELAYNLARRAQRAFRHELGVEDANFIEFGYWDNLVKGLHAGEGLLKDLRRMEVAYLDLNRREFELTKHVSLALLNPIELLRLKQGGSCEVELPEELFDLDYPGHYFRRIKSVSITIPAVTGPYTTLACTSRLLRSSIRRQSTLLNGQYARDLDNDDPRFSDSLGAIQSIATSSGRNDSGLFELNFRDERYLPFEGAGVISRWQLEMPGQFRQFDYDSIPDIILHINYTAREGGGALGAAATQHLLDGINAMVTGADAPGLHQSFSARHEFPTEFHRFLHPAVESDQQTLTLNLAQNRFPYMFRGRDINVDQAHVFVRLADEFNDASDTEFTLIHPGGEETVDLGTAFSLGNVLQVSVSNINSEPGEWTLTASSVGEGLTDEANQLNSNAIEDIIVILHYTIAMQ
ncbi:MAG: hypothetical protein GEU77_09750 [Deltaproteobacteria bacterium]|nr:hypothetical protein [Deltaproteobacteria bacterium]